jgi:hypothetical protein
MGMKHTLWLDIDSGTYGPIRGCVIVELTSDQLDWFEDASDDERQTYGEDHGCRIMEWS